MSEKVSILMSIYRPNFQWLKEQLISLNNQDYDDIDMFVWNDCPEDLIEYESILAEHITKFPYSYLRATENLGVAKAFEKLTTLADGEYIAYCDQDDRWLPHKISTLVNHINRTEASVVTSNMHVIDGDGNRIKEKFFDKVPDIQKMSIEEQIALFLRGGISTGYGCVMLCKLRFVKEIIPFCDLRYGFHDTLIIFCAMLRREYVILDECLIDYRRHNRNLSGVINNINTKSDYLKWCNEDHALGMRMGEFVCNLGLLKLVRKRYDGKHAYFKNPTFEGLIKFCSDDIYTAKAKVAAILFLLPDWMFELAVKVGKKFVR